MLRLRRTSSGSAAAAACCIVWFWSGGALGASNDPPEIEAAEFYLDEDKSLSASIKARDQNGDAISFKLVRSTKNGEATLSADGKVTYTPKPNWHGKDELTFEVSDGKARVQRKATFEVSSVNDPPTAAPVEVRGQEDKPVKGQIVVKDLDGDPVTFTLMDGPSKGSLLVDPLNGKFTLNPGPNENGKLNMQVRISDGTSDATVSVVVILEPTNDAPTASSEELITKEDVPLSGKLPGADVDSGDTLTFTITDKPAKGSVVISDAAQGAYTYTPPKEYAGDDAFGFSVTDGKATAKGRVSVEVQNVNDPPTIYPLAIEGNEDQPLKGKVIAKDFDGDDVYFTVKTDPKHGDIEIDHQSGVITFTPKDNWNGTDTLTVEAADIAGAVGAPVTITIKPVNDPPSPSASDARGEEDQPVSGKLKATDVDGDALQFALVKQPARAGSVEIKSDGTFKLTPSAHFNGEDTFTWEVSDGKGLKANGSTSLTIKPVNDAPTAANIALQLAEDGQVKGVVSGVDIDKDKLGYELARKSKKGKVEVDSETGQLTYKPNLDENGDDSFSVKVSDGTAEAEATVTVAIAAVNDAPVAAPHATKGDEDTQLKGTATASDVDKDTLSYVVVSKPKNGELTMDERTGAYTFAPRAHYYGEDAFKFQVSDGKLKSTADVKLTVAPVNDVPDVKNATLPVTEDKLATVSIVASDIDKDKLTYTEAKPPAKGVVAVDAATGKCTYTPKLNENGEDTFVVAVSDGNARSEATVSVSIAPVNDVPVVEAGAGRGNEDAPIEGKLVASDVDKDRLTWVAATQPRLGKVDVDPATGAYKYTPRAHENGDDAFKFEVSDGALKASAEVKLTVVAVNDTPEPKDLAVTTSEDKDASGRVSAFDIDKDTLTFRLKKAPAQGLVIVDDASGAFRYAPARDTHGRDTFVVEATDGFASADATVTVDVAPQPDAPLVDPRPIITSEDEPVVTKLSAIDADAGEDVTFKIVSQPARLGTMALEGDNKTLRFTPRADQHGEDAVVVEATDGKNKVRATLPVLVAARNDAPTLDPAAATTTEEQPVSVAVSAHDKDGDAIKLALDGKSAKADFEHKVTLTGNVVSVVPKRDFAGAVEVDVVATDAAGAASAPLKLVVTVNNVNDAPVTRDVTLRAQPEKAVNGSVDASDVDAGDELVYSLAAPPRKGSVTLEDIAGRNGKFTYTANAGASGEDSFRIRVKDKAGASVSSTVKITIGAPPAPPPPAAAPPAPAPPAAAPKAAPSAPKSSP